MLFYHISGSFGRQNVEFIFDLFHRQLSDLLQRKYYLRMVIEYY
jgi:hypothetical protein